MKKFFFVYLVATSFVFSQLDANYFLDANHPYDPAIPTPASILGYEVGEWHVSHDKLVQYMTTLAASSDRVSIENRGATYEDRPLLLLTITHPDNHKDIERIREEHLQLSAPNSESLRVEEMPIVV